jgi:LEA14-like dessication related protein
MLFIIGCKIKPVDIGNVEKVSLIEKKEDTLLFEVYVPLENRNNISFKIKDIAIKVLIDKDTVGEIAKVYDLKIPAKSKSVHRIMFTFLMPDYISGSLYFFKLISNQKMEIHLRGYIKASSGFVSKKVTIDQTIPFNPFRKIE